MATAICETLLRETTSNDSVIQDLISPIPIHRRFALRLNVEKCLVALTLSLTAFPIWAAHSYSEDFNPTEPISIGTTQLKPGQYVLKAEEGKSEVQVFQ